MAVEQYSQAEDFPQHCDLVWVVREEKEIYARTFKQNTSRFTIGRVTACVSSGM